MSDFYRREAQDQWRGFRGFIKRNPLSGFWIGAAFGATVVIATSFILA